jgi:magnesium chelatase family protein
MPSRITSATLVGVEAKAVEVEVESIERGLPGFQVVGLPDGAIREGVTRVRAAVQSSGFELKQRRTTVNLAPADLRKDGAAFDLPIALAWLAEHGRVLLRERWLIAGELALDGRVRPIRGALALAQGARALGLDTIVLPEPNAPEAALVRGMCAYGVTSLSEAVAVLDGKTQGRPATPRVAESNGPQQADFADVIGQPAARRAAEIAAAGGHNLMLVGAPGSGKTMIAKRIGGVLPPMTREEAIEATTVHSVAGLLNDGPMVTQRPFRAPHHTCSTAGLIGGGSPPRPGEVSLAHNGVLFLDELPEFRRQSLEALRQPLEGGSVTVVRARDKVTFPAQLMLVAAMNPCPCGYWGSEVRSCRCGARQAQRYAARLSGPLLDRFDLFVHVQPVPAPELLRDGAKGESSAAIAERVGAARAIQHERFRKRRARCNAQISSRALWRHCRLSNESRRLLEAYGEAHGLSARALHRSCRVARTIADLVQRVEVDEGDIALALSMQRECVLA